MRNVWKKIHRDKIKRHKQLLKKKLTNMTEKLLMTLKKEKGHTKLWDIINMLRGKKKHGIIEEKNICY